jgi:hypothetical protein
LNPSPARFGVRGYIVLHPDPHILEHIRIPEFDLKDTVHLRLAELSENAHNAAKKDDLKSIQGIEDEIDNLSTQIWGLSPEELKEMKASLKEMSE